MNRLFPWLLTSLLLPATRAQSEQALPHAKESTEQVVARLKQVIPRLLQDRKVPGLSIALLRHGELAWHQGFGVKDAQSQEPVGDDTVFEAASLSKPVFAYLVMQLVDAGSIDLDKPLQEYLPGNDDVGDDARLAKITARHVLSHTTGFPNWRPPGGRLTIHFQPGERFSYSGEGYVYLAKVVEHVTGEKLNDLMTKKVFEPLHMTDSSFVWRDSYDRQSTSRHDSSGAVTPQNRSTEANAAASLRTTARDYGRFLVAILHGTGLKADTRQQMLTPQIKVSASGVNNTARAPEKLSSSLSWGLGWGLQSTSAGMSFWHWGDNGTTKAFVIVDEHEGAGLVVFANSANGLSIVPQIVDTALGGEMPALSWLRLGSAKRK